MKSVHTMNSFNQFWCIYNEIRQKTSTSSFHHPSIILPSSFHHPSSSFLILYPSSSFIITLHYNPSSSSLFIILIHHSSYSSFLFIIRLIHHSYSSFVLFIILIHHPSSSFSIFHFFVHQSVISKGEALVIGFMNNDNSNGDTNCNHCFHHIV